MAGSTLRNLHVPLHEDLYRRLRAECRRRRRPATALAREAIEQWLDESRRRSIHEAIVSYAREVAGSRDDLDPELEAAAVDHALRESQSPSRRKKRARKK